jgi:hypothetical protein
MPIADASTTELLRKERRWFIDHPYARSKKEYTPISLALQSMRGFCATMAVN